MNIKNKTENDIQKLKLLKYNIMCWYPLGFEVVEAWWHMVLIILLSCFPLQDKVCKCNIMVNDHLIIRWWPPNSLLLQLLHACWLHVLTLLLWLLERKRLIRRVCTHTILGSIVYSNFDSKKLLKSKLVRYWWHNNTPNIILEIDQNTLHAYGVQNTWERDQTYQINIVEFYVSISIWIVTQDPAWVKTSGGDELSQLSLHIKKPKAMRIDHNRMTRRYWLDRIILNPFQFTKEK